MRLRQDYLKESPGQYAHGECYRKHFFVPHKSTVQAAEYGPDQPPRDPILPVLVNQEHLAQGDVYRRK